MQKTDLELSDEFDIIENETAENGNTRGRVASAFKNLSDSKINNDKIDSDPGLETEDKTLAGRDAVKAYIASTVSQAITSAIQNLVNGAPAALDTLQELSAALQDDADIVSSIITQLGEKAEKTDVEIIEVNAISAAAVLTNDDFGKIHTLTNNGGTTDYIVTVPMPSGLNVGKTIFFKGLPSLTKTVTLSNGAVTFDGDANWKISKGGLVGLRSDGTNYTVISEIGSWYDYQPTVVGYSVTHTPTARVFKQGKQFSFFINLSSALSNSTLLNVSLPFVCAAGTWIVRVQNNSGAYTAGLATVVAGTSTLDLYASPNFSAFTASGNKGAVIMITGAIA